MAQLTNRQIEILKFTCQEFIDSARPVGSEAIEKKYNLGVSPATIRNEMSQLTQLGYLKKPHTSAGRMPTSMGLRYYVRNLMTPKKLSITEEVGVKEKIWDSRNDFESLLKETIKELSHRTQALAIVVDDEGSFYTYGLSNLLDYQEFFDIDVTKTILSLMDKTDYWTKIMERAFSNEAEESFHLLIGEELNSDFLEQCGFVYQIYKTGPHRGVIGIMGPSRLRYTDVVPLVDYVARLISEIGNF